jgi:hypothetical protein
VNPIPLRVAAVLFLLLSCRPGPRRYCDSAVDCAAGADCPCVDAGLDQKDSGSLADAAAIDGGSDEDAIDAAAPSGADAAMDGGGDDGGPSGEACTPQFRGASSAIPISNRRVALTWSAATDCASPPSEIVYDICIATAAGRCAESFSVAKTTSPGASLWNLGGLSSDTQYFFVVRARNRANRADDNRVEVSAVTGGRRAVVAGGSAHVCELSQQGTVRCWGSNADGEVGNGVLGGPQWLPMEVAGLSGVERLAVGGYHTCGLLAKGTVVCWGSNDYGQAAGDRSETNLPSPVEVTGVLGAIDVTAGAAHTCALLTDGTAICWGFGGRGELGNGSALDQLAPVKVSGLANAVGLSAGGGTTCAVLDDGTAKCWGQNDSGQTGNGVTAPSELQPVAVSGLTGVVAIETGSHSCALRADGTARCWGFNGNGQVGTGLVLPSNQVSTPTEVAGLEGASALALGGTHTCAVMADQTARCWGENYFGELGDGRDGWVVIPPVSVSNLTGIASLAAGSEFSCAITRDDATYCWGVNLSGQLGNGGVGDLRRLPVPVGCPSGAAVCNGRCVFLENDASNCGACGKACSAGTCQSGICTCPPATVPCGSMCADLNTDAQNCGRCDVACLLGETCQAGQCRCDAPKEVCEEACVDVSSDPSNCGLCSVVCASGEWCVGGRCQQCRSGTTLCGSSCVDLRTDSRNCGACGAACDLPGAWNCRLGNCVCGDFDPITHWRICNGVCLAINGSDPANCGGCEQTCGEGQLCFGDRCRCQYWMSGQDWCGGKCVDLQTSAANCGACWVACAPTEVCQAGRCH